VASIWRGQLPVSVWAANVDNFRSSAVAWQAGQCGVSDPRTSVSNWCEHSLQAYS
jgi:hypothetical protein